MSYGLVDKWEENEGKLKSVRFYVCSCFKYKEWVLLKSKV